MAVTIDTDNDPYIFCYGTTAEVLAHLEAQNVPEQSIIGIWYSSAGAKTPHYERILGSAGSGSDGDKNQTFDLAHTPTSNSLLLAVSQAIRHPTDDWTLSTATVTFLCEIYDADIILAYYEYGDASTAYTACVYRR